MCSAAVVLMSTDILNTSCFVRLFFDWLGILITCRFLLNFSSLFHWCFLGIFRVEILLVRCSLLLSRFSFCFDPSLAHLACYFWYFMVIFNIGSLILLLLLHWCWSRLLWHLIMMNFLWRGSVTTRDWRFQHFVLVKGVLCSQLELLSKKRVVLPQWICRILREEKWRLDLVIMVLYLIVVLWRRVLSLRASLVRILTERRI